MRRAEAVLGVIMVAAGFDFVVAGRVLPGGFMTGSRFWMVPGALVGLAGLALFLDGARRPAA